MVNISAPGSINYTLQDVGNGLGELFGAIDVPIGTLLIIIGIAGSIVTIFGAIVMRIRRGM